MISISPTPNLISFGLFMLESKNTPGEVAQSEPTCQHHFSGVLHPHIHDPGIRNFTAGVSHQSWNFRPWIPDYECWNGNEVEIKIGLSSLSMNLSASSCHPFSSILFHHFMTMMSLSCIFLPFSWSTFWLCSCNEVWKISSQANQFNEVVFDRIIVIMCQNILLNH